MSRKVGWHLFVLSVARGMGAFLSVCQWSYLASLHFRLRGQPDRKHLAETQEGCKNGIYESEVVRCSLLAKLSLLCCTCTHTTGMHSSGVTGWMQIGRDSSRAMIYWVIGATHEWRCSTTHSKSPILLFIPAAGPPPSPSAHSSLSLQSLSTISQRSSMPGSIHLSPLTFLSVNFERLRRGDFYLTLFRLWKPQS